MNPFIAAAFAIAMAALVAGCAGTGSAGSTSGASSASSGNGVTVFGTIDASVSGSTNRSDRR
ncbi:hypothetical protein NU688_23060 [Variovorax sp. ZS18.2.2]|uniref:hypothetical protein n=1 Tax=Variovorax sp. ZS18.2.2 TaxID=2971255 RepID=UPI002151FB9A|nr:hypothetical protein [Variovorax sp. ZS18.2.2]MCR6479057.1 hypothetical protein [Variovorax sp. ZS18.2.2]